MPSRVIFSSTTAEWRTPEWLYRSLNEEFHFDFDPCPLGGIEDGLAPLFVSWTGRRVFCNPPYGPGIREWLERGREADLAVYLIPARTSSPWFHDLVLPQAREVRFIRGRLKFNGSIQPAPFPSMVVIFKKESA